MTRPTLIETLALERLELNLFRGFSPEEEKVQIFGGQVIAQSLLAAYETVEARVCHSLHCYFLRSGNPRIPILFEVDRARDGGSFTTRRVVAIQDGKQIFNLSASFKTPEKGFEHQLAMPQTPPPESLPSQTELLAALPERTPHQQQQLDVPRAVDMRGFEGLIHSDAPMPSRDPQVMRWLRAVETIGDDVKLQQALLAYASDMAFLSTSYRPHGLYWNMAGLQSASLDHSIWFHRPFDFNDWHLFHQESPIAHGGLGLNRASIFARDGRLVASATQESLMRLKP